MSGSNRSSAKSGKKPMKGLPSLMQGDGMFPNYGMFAAGGPSSDIASLSIDTRPSHPTRQNRAYNNPPAAGVPKGGRVLPPPTVSKAGVPPPPSNGGRKSTQKLKSMPSQAMRTESPSLHKTQPLPKIGASKSNSAQKSVENELTEVETVLHGHITDSLPVERGHFIRVFLSSTFSDLKAERNEIWASVFPAVRQYCLKLAIDFNFIDMRWGVQDQATDEHLTEDIVLQEVQRCIDISAATSFISIIGHRYGSIVNDRKISKEKFEVLLEIAEKNSLPNRSLLYQWYKLDANNVPPAYRLQRISSVLPGYLSEDLEAHNQASNDWYNISKSLLQCVYDATSIAVSEGKLSNSDLEDLQKSVTVREIDLGILKNEMSGSTTFSVYRQFTGIEQDLEDSRTAKYIDVETVDGVKTAKAMSKKSIENFILNPISDLLMPEARKDFVVRWKPGGIPVNVSDQDEEDRQYLDSLSRELIQLLNMAADNHMIADHSKDNKDYKITSPYNRLSSRKQSSSQSKHVCTMECKMKCALSAVNSLRSGLQAIEEDTDLVDSISNENFKEILHHLQIAATRSKLFSGRETELTYIKNQLRNSGWTTPLFIHAKGGEGKTSLVSEIVRRVHNSDWLGANSVVAIRYIGTSRQSQNLTGILKSIYTQISCAYVLRKTLPKNITLPQLIIRLEALYANVAFHPLTDLNFPCLVIFDGLDQLKPSEIHCLRWIPRSLPPNVHLIITYQSEKHNISSYVMERFGEAYALPPMSVEDLLEFNSKALKFANRDLAPEQRVIVEGKIAGCPSPLYSKLITQEAVSIASYESLTSLPSNSEEAIHNLLTRLEVRYGSSLVAYTSAFITLSMNGISESELEDALSCSDEVLIDVYVYHPPPIPGVVRVPSHLWPMLMNELQQYLMEKKTDNHLLISWFHKQQFEDVVKAKYCSTEEQKHCYHQILADIRTTSSGVHRTITLSKLRQPLTIENADRQVASQSLAHCSLRTLFSMAHHLARAGDLDAFKGKAVYNLDFIKALWRQNHLRALYYLCVEENTTNDEEIKAMAGAMKSGAFLNEEDFSDKSLVDLCTHLIGCLLANKNLPHTSRLFQQIDKHFEMHKDVLLIPKSVNRLLDTSIVQWFGTGFESTHSVSSSENLVSFLCSGGKKSVAVDVVNSRSYDISSKELIKQVKTAKHRVFALTDSAVHIKTFHHGKESTTKLATKSLDKKSSVYRYMTVSSTGHMIALGSKDSLVICRTNSATSDQPSYKAIGSLTCGGTVATDCILFSPDESYTISAHTIQGKNSRVGGIVKWDYTKSTTDARLSIPNPVYRGHMYLLTEDLVLCVTVKSEVLIVSIKGEKIVDKIHDGGEILADICFDSGWLAIVFEGESLVTVWNLSDKKKTTLTCSSRPTHIALSSTQAHVYVALRSGCLEVFDLYTSESLKMFSVADISLKSLKLISPEYLALINQQTESYVVNIESLMTAQQVDHDDPNDLGAAKRGVFSADGQMLLVERGSSEPIDVIDMESLQKVTVFASAGYGGVTLCGGHDYTVGRNDSGVVGVWNLSKGQPVPLPAALNDQTFSCVNVSLTEPLVELASNGVLYRWNITNSNLQSCHFTGTSVIQLKSSSEVTALLTTNGTREGDSQILHIISGRSWSVVGSLEMESEVEHLCCSDESVFYCQNGSLYFIKSGQSTPDVLETSDLVCLSACGDTVAACDCKDNVTLINGRTGTVMAQVSIGSKISQLHHLSSRLSLISRDMGIIQIIQWGDNSTSPTKLSNRMKTGFGHLYTKLSADSEWLYLFGSLLMDSGLLKIQLCNI